MSEQEQCSSVHCLSDFNDFILQAHHGLGLSGILPGYYLLHLPDCMIAEAGYITLISIKRSHITILMAVVMFENITCCLHFRVMQMITQTGVLRVPHISKALMPESRGKVKVEIFLTQIHIISARLITDRY